MSEWPVPYFTNDPTGSPPNPGWPKREQVIEAGHALALKFLSDPRKAEQYRAFALDGRKHDAENAPGFRDIIASVYMADYTDFNSNDFANVHHVAWILIGRALASLTNQNPHGDWGDPPVNGSLHFEDPPVPAFYHFVPNKTGYYAVGTTDTGLTAPNLGV